MDFEFGKFCAADGRARRSIRKGGASAEIPFSPFLPCTPLHETHGTFLHRRHCSIFTRIIVSFYMFFFLLFPRTFLLTYIKGAAKIFPEKTYAVVFTLSINFGDRFHRMFTVYSDLGWTKYTLLNVEFIFKEKGHEGKQIFVDVWLLNRCFFFSSPFPILI